MRGVRCLQCGGNEAMATPYWSGNSLHGPAPPFNPLLCLPVQVITLSFTTIIGIMIGTFFVVLKMGAIRMND